MNRYLEVGEGRSARKG